MPTNMVTRRLGPLLVLRENGETPSDAEWDECLRLLSSDPKRLVDTRVLVITDGGGPTPDQRRRLKRALDGFAVPVAVVSESIKVRFIVSSVALVTSRIKSFSLREMNDALRYLELSLDEIRDAQREIKEMTALLD